MTSVAEALPDSAPLGRDLLVRVRDRRHTADEAEREILELAVQYAHANPALPGQEVWQPATLPSWLDPASEAGTDPQDLEWHGLPAMRWDAPAAFAAANGMSTTAGKALIRDGLVLVHRAPGVWAAVAAGQLPVWRARKVAQALLGQHDDVCAYLDQALVQRIATEGAVGPVVLERLIDEAMLRLHAEERELEQLEALDKRHVTIDPATINHHGIGVLADPTQAKALLEGDLDATPTRVRELVATLHLTEANLLHLDPVVADADQRAHLDQVIRSWVGRHDIALTVRTIRHCGGLAGGCVDCPGHLDCDNHDSHARRGYVPTRLDREILELAAKTCVHPYVRSVIRFAVSGPQT